MSDDIAADVAALKEWALEKRCLMVGGQLSQARWPTSEPARVERVLAFLENQSRLCVALAEAGEGGAGRGAGEGGEGGRGVQRERHGRGHRGGHPGGQVA